MIVKTVLSVLVVDSSTSSSNETTALLVQGSDQFKVYQADSLYEAFKVTERRTIDVLVLELALTDSTGYKTFQRCRDQLPEMPIVIHTLTQNEIISVQAIRGGAQDYLVKGSADARSLQRAVYFASQRQEITLRVQEENRKLQKEIRALEETQDIGAFGSWEMDVLHQELTGNERFFDLLGIRHTGAGISSRVYLEGVHPADRDQVRHFFADLMHAPKTLSCRHRILVQGTQTRHLELTGRIRADQSSQQILALGILQELTETTEVLALREEQQYSRKLGRIRDKVLNDFAFRIRTPLYSMVNFLYLLEESPYKVQNRDAFSGLKQSMDELQHSINQLITLSLATEDQPNTLLKSFGLTEAFQTIQKMLDFRRDHQPLTMEFRLDRRIPKEVIGDQKKMVQIFYNLYDLFLNLSDDPRKVSIRIKAETTDPDWINLQVACRDPKPAPPENRLDYRSPDLLVQDMGTDRPEADDLVRINLITMDKLVRSMGGSSQVKQHANTPFRIDLVLPFRIPSAREPEVPTQDWIEPLRILLVEDHFLNQIATRNVLLTWSPEITVDIAENGLVAVEKAQAHEYDLILMDIQMPVMNGLDAARKIRESSEIPIIALSASASEQEADKCLKAGFNDYLAKPFKPEELKHKVFRLSSIIR